jgi:Ca2+-binding EF-hand superfamily protein
LYDLNNDNVITLDELSMIFFAVYRLLGDNVNQKHDQMTYEQQAERLYNKIDLEQSDSITREQFINYCKRDSSIVDTIHAGDVHMFHCLKRTPHFFALFILAV